MKKFLILPPLLLCFCFLSAQKVKIKKDIIYIDKEEYGTWDRDYGYPILKSTQGTAIASFKYYSYDAPNPAHYNRNDPNSHRYPATIKKGFFEVSFIDIDLNFETDLARNKLLTAFSKEGVINSEGSVDEANAHKLARLIGKDISSTVPVTIIHR